MLMLTFKNSLKEKSYKIKDKAAMKKMKKKLEMNQCISCITIQFFISFSHFFKD